MMKIIRVLLVDDDEDDYLLMQNYLEDIPDTIFELTWVYHYLDALEKIENHSYDIYIYDFFLGSKTGLDLLEDTKKLYPDTAIILLTGKGNSDVDRKAMQLGAMDYLIKGELDSEKIERSIRYTLERITVLRALRESEQKYRDIFDQSKDFIFLIDTEGYFKDVNAAGTQIFGYSQEEFLHMRLHDLMQEDLQQKHHVLFAIQARKDINECEIVLHSKKKKKVYSLISLRVQPDKEEGYFQGTTHDITEKRRLERNARMAEKIAVSGRLVRTLGHEIRNPLTNVTLALNQLQSELINDDLFIYTDIINRNIIRINDLISQLLESLKPTEVSRKKYPIHTLLDESLQLAEDRLKLKQIQVVKKYDLSACELSLDKPQVIIALLNLITNAIEAMSENVGILTIGTEVTDDYCELFVEDNGSGIAEEDLSHLFEPYFTTKKDGVGLGLSSSLNILQSHNATVDIESEVERGTVFTIRFSLKEDDQSEA